MNEGEISPISVFVSHGHVPPTAGAWRGEHCIRYHSRLIPNSRDLRDALAYDYRETAALGSEEFPGVLRERSG